MAKLSNHVRLKPQPFEQIPVEGIATLEQKFDTVLSKDASVLLVY